MLSKQTVKEDLNWQYWYCWNCNTLTPKNMYGSYNEHCKYCLTRTIDPCAWVLHCTFKQRSQKVPLKILIACEICKNRFDCYSWKLPEGYIQ